MTPAAIFCGVLTCGLWCPLLVWTDRTRLPALRMCRPLQIKVPSGLFLTAWGVRGVIDLLGLL